MHIISVWPGCHVPSPCTHMCSRAIVCYAALLSMYLLHLICTYMRVALYANVIRCVCICCDPCRIFLRSTLPPECSLCLFTCRVRCKFFIHDQLVLIVVNSRTLLIINNNLLPIEYFDNYFAYREIFGIGQVSIAITTDFRIVTN